MCMCDRRCASLHARATPHPVHPALQHQQAQAAATRRRSTATGAARSRGCLAGRGSTSSDWRRAATPLPPGGAMASRHPAEQARQPTSWHCLVPGRLISVLPVPVVCEAYATWLLTVHVHAETLLAASPQAQRRRCRRLRPACMCPQCRCATLRTWRTADRRRQPPAAHPQPLSGRRSVWAACTTR